MRHKALAAVALLGIGNVGRAFLELLVERRPSIRLAAVADSVGALLGELDAAEALAYKSRGHIKGHRRSVEELVDAGAEVLVDTTRCDFETGEPALSLIQQGLMRGVSVATANKAPLARAWAPLWKTSDEGRRLRYAAAAGAGLPAVAVARALSRMDVVESVEGVLTGTAAFVLDEMAGGRTLDEAVISARKAGIAEPNPQVDLNGSDTAAKLVILANTLWPDGELDLRGLTVRGVEALDPADLNSAPVRILGWASKGPEGIRAGVEPTPLRPDHPLHGVRGSEKGVTFRGPAIGTVTIRGGRSHPKGAAAALLGDVLDLAETSR